MLSNGAMPQVMLILQLMLIKDNLSCHENEIINEDNSSNVDSVLGLENGKTFKMLGQEWNVFWCAPDYTLDWYKEISNIHLKDDIL